MVERIDTPNNKEKIKKRITRKITAGARKEVVSGEQPGEDEGKQI